MVNNSLKLALDRLPRDCCGLEMVLEHVMTAAQQAPAAAPDAADDAQAFGIKDFRLRSGVVMPVVDIAYRTLGQLAPDRNNAVLVTHGNTSGPQMIDPGGSTGEGSWKDLVGPGKAIDTDRYFVICPNMLGSSYGSTNAASIDPMTGKAYGSRFPDITVGDNRRQPARAAR